METEKKKRGRKSIKFLLTFIIIPILLNILIEWKFSLSWILIMLAIKIWKIHKRNYLIKDKEGKPVKTNEFFKRWKSGIEGITPLQQAKTNLMGNWIVFSGIVAGIVINALVRMENQWIWIEVILVGSLILVIIQMIGGLQRYWRFKEIDKQMKELEQ